jgi:DNA-directed RNA polymerase subunit H (RpoH/RPB5)
VILHDVRGNILTLSRSNGKEYGSYDWGFASNSLGYKEEKPAEEPQEDKMPEGLTFMEQRKWLAEHKAKPAAAITKPKEVVTAPAADSSKSKVEKHPEGGTEVKLDPKLGIIDGRVVRPAIGLQDRMLKDWYKVHDKDGCPQNFKQARPAIPFERLKVESGIRKFLEASGLFVTGVSSKDTEPHHVESSKTLPTATGLTPDQIAKAVKIHKNATFVVDPAQFTANEKEHPTFLQRLGITPEEFPRLSTKDMVAILEVVGNDEFMRGIRVLCGALKPELFKTVPETITQDEKKPEEKPELSFMEQRRQAALASKSKVA